MVNVESFFANVKSSAKPLEKQGLGGACTAVGANSLCLNPDAPDERINRIF
jgi:hypothetical protein